MSHTEKKRLKFCSNCNFTKSNKHLQIVAYAFERFVQSFAHYFRNIDESSKKQANYTNYKGALTHKHRHTHTDYLDDR